MTEALIERRCCDECGFTGIADEAHPLVDCCSRCGENNPRCGAENCLGYACPDCGGRYALDASVNDEPVTEHSPECWGRTSYSDEMTHCYCTGSETNAL